jgi:hypothetical protein
MFPFRAERGGAIPVAAGVGSPAIPLDSAVISADRRRPDLARLLRAVARRAWGRAATIPPPLKERRIAVEKMNGVKLGR